MAGGSGQVTAMRWMAALMWRFAANEPVPVGLARAGEIRATPAAQGRACVGGRRTARASSEVVSIGRCRYSAGSTTGESRSTRAAISRACLTSFAITETSPSTVAKISSGPATVSPTVTSTSTITRSPSRGRHLREPERGEPAAGRRVDDRVDDAALRLPARLQRRREPERRPDERLDEIHAPDLSHVLPDAAAAEPRVDLDDARPARGALALHVQDAAVQPERLDRLDDEVHEPADLALVVIGRAVETRLLERGLGGRPVLGHAREDALAVVHHEVDVELDAVEVLLQQQVVARPEDRVARGRATLRTSE